jgi:hypothetical protein
MISHCQAEQNPGMFDFGAHRSLTHGPDMPR